MENTSYIHDDESPSGAAMVPHTLNADPADIEMLTTFGEGDISLGLHRAAQMVRGKLLGELMAHAKAEIQYPVDSES